MTNDHQPVFPSEIDLRKIGGATGLPIPPTDPFEQDRHDRGRPFTDVEIADWVSDRRYLINNRRAAVVTEIAVQLWDEKHELEIIHTGTFQERLEALGVELSQSDDPVQNLAGKFVEIALLHLRGGM